MMKKLKLGCTILLFGFIAAVTMRFDGNFNNGDKTAGGRLSPSNPHTDTGVLITTEYAVSGYALKFTVASNNIVAPYYPREEKIISKTGNDSAIADDYFGYNVTLLDWVTDARQGLIHQDFTEAYPVFSVWFTTISGQPWLQIVRQYDSTAIGDGSTLDANFVQEKWNLKQIISGETIRLDFKRKWRWDYTGSIEVYLNKVLVKTFTGANTIRPYNISVPKQPVSRVGIYWFGAKTHPGGAGDYISGNSGPVYPILTRRAIFDNISIGRASDITWDDYLNYYTTSVPPITPTPSKIFAPWRLSN